MLDETDRKILNILQEKARVPNVEVARQVEMAPSAVLERIRKLENQGFIDGYEVRLNPKQFGMSLVAFITVKLTDLRQEREVGNQLKRIPEVQEVHYVAGEDAFLLKVRVSDTDQLGLLIREQLAAIPAVGSLRTSIVFSTYKETALFPIDKAG
jgi:Lrp/AsnC family leucine-responsive transcriptional regulator